MNCNAQNKKIEAINEKTLVIGIDVGSETHYARAFNDRGIEYSKRPFRFCNSEAGFESLKAWITEFQKKHGKTKVVPGMEPTGHYWFNLGKFLQDNGMRPVLVNPHHVKKSKELDDNNPTKNDRKDPKVIAGLVKDGRYMIPYLPDGVYAELRTASNMRFQLQSELTRIRNRISRWFSIYFPEYKTVYGKPDAVSGILILKKAPLPEDIVTLGVSGVNQIWREAKLRAVGIKRAQTLLNAAEHSVGSKEGARSARMEIQMLLDDYESKNARLQEVLTFIEELVAKIPVAEKLMGIKGVGIRTVSGFLAEVGDISRFNSPKELQKLAGLALVENSSGKHKGQTTISRRGRKRLRYLLFEAAMSLVSKNPEFRELHRYYTTRAVNPLKKMQSLMAVATKLIRVFYAIMIKDIEYDPEKMIGDIKRPAAYLKAA
ncbi:MAG: IS110 family transposase [Clostridia bacterium]|nr:IS110 family transposase [Clostridia bacterium]